MQTEIGHEEIQKLHRTIVEEGINKSNDSDSSDEDNSDDEILMKFIPKTKSKSFDTTVYAFQLNNKLSKIRSELSRYEERLRYLQLDYNNKEVKIEELIETNKTIKQQLQFKKNEVEYLLKENIVLKRNKTLLIYSFFGVTFAIQFCFFYFW